ncbi:flavodoxin family protein [Clostridium beijerinckii]|uniref:flavodoxin family protein n=1 Tax=Clostridium beijerinckii TaxID=1520 RepID=UPI00098CBE3D|nr:flavodoxin family protein [Clostridium beijerinckii]NRT80489.1 multimeric flavodoxin WrbA [Clostridium beijerinckii]OOM42305.1 iron-sulfur flavoprotein [Clostridium beijerinckii]
MKVLGIMGSPRLNGNSSTLLKKVLEGAKDNGAVTNSISVSNLDIKGCVNCDACKRLGKCVIKDDMQNIYDMINDADIVVFSSPNYMGGIQGKLKCVMDRLYAYMKEGLDKSFDKEKKVALIVTQNAPEETSSCYEAFNHLRYVLNVTFEGNSEVPCRFLLGGGLVTRDSAGSNKELMNKAYSMGKELVQGV